MRSYYPILSIVVASIALTVPAILIAWPFRTDSRHAASEPAPSATDQLRTELKQLSESLAELRQRMAELERPSPSTATLSLSPDELRRANSKPSTQLAPTTAQADDVHADSRQLPHTTREELPRAGGLVAVVEPQQVRETDPAPAPLSAPAPSNHSMTTREPIAHPSLVIPNPMNAPERTLESTLRSTPAIASMTPFPASNSQLLLAARPHPAYDASDSPGVVTRAGGELPETAPSPPSASRSTQSRPIANGDQTSAARRRAGRNASAGRATAQPVPHMPTGMLEDFSTMDAQPLDHWNDAPSFALSITRPSSGLVRHWEEFVATTSVSGWPVVMVRSEAEGDHWWVQQLVARQGNVIAAKVSFGNEETTSGHHFDVVVLLLESSAEAIRFRTARKFKELPEGVPRSEIYRYVRR